RPSDRLEIIEQRPGNSLILPDGLRVQYSAFALFGDNLDELRDRIRDNVCPISAIVPVLLGWNQLFEVPEHNCLGDDSPEILVVELQRIALPLRNDVLAEEIEVLLGALAHLVRQLPPRILYLCKIGLGDDLAPWILHFEAGLLGRTHLGGFYTVLTLRAFIEPCR